MRSPRITHSIIWRKRGKEAAVGDLVFLKRQAREDSLVPRFDGPYRVLDRNNSDVKLRLPRRDK